MTASAPLHLSDLPALRETVAGWRGGAERIALVPNPSGEGDDLLASFNVQNGTIDTYTPEQP